MTDEEKQNYIDDYEQHENIRLDPTKIEKNPVLRTCGKLALNCLWVCYMKMRKRALIFNHSILQGKFAQRKDLPKTAVLSMRKELLQLLNAPNVKVHNVIDGIGSKIIINYSDTESRTHNTNSIVAAITTCHARILLYQLLHILGERVLYYDTDSVLFVQRDGEKELPCSNYLGGLANELEKFGNGAEIKEYISSGPKDYYLKIKLADGSLKHIRKLKGISLKKNNEEETSGRTLKDLIDGKLDSITVDLIRKIQKTSGFEIYSVNSKKDLRMVYNKRARVDAYRTIPWGTKQNEPEVVPDNSIVIEDWETLNLRM
jgi:hypothetical protein